MTTTFDDDAGRPVDAIRTRVDRAGGGSAAERLTRLAAEFAPRLGAGRIFVRNQGGEYFLTADPADTLLFPGGGERSGESRYLWETSGDGVHHGYLKSAPPRG